MLEEEPVDLMNLLKSSMGRQKEFLLREETQKVRAAKKLFEKVVPLRLLKNGQMQGARNPEE